MSKRELALQIRVDFQKSALWVFEEKGAMPCGLISRWLENRHPFLL